MSEISFFDRRLNPHPPTPTLGTQTRTGYLASLMRNCDPVGPCSGTTPGVLGGSWGGWFLMSEVPLYYEVKPVDLHGTVPPKLCLQTNQSPLTC